MANASHSIDHIALVINRLVLSGRATGELPISHVELVGPTLMRMEVDIECRLPAVRKTRTQGSDDSTRYILSCPLFYVIAKYVAQTDGPITIRLFSNKTLLLEKISTIGSYRSSGIADDPTAIKTLCAGMAEVDAGFASMLASIAADEPEMSMLWWRLDTRLSATGCGLVVAGEARGLSGSNVLFLVDECRLAINPELIVIGPPIQPKRIGESGGTTANTFTCFEQLSGDRHELRIASVSGTHVQWSNSQIIAEATSPRQLLDRIARLVPSGELIERPVAVQTLRSIAEISGRLRADVSELVIAESEAPPDLSIIVPFYRDDFFLLDHLESQRRTDVNAEWIFVCDDPALLPSMKRLCASRRGSMSKATRLIALSRNAGFAAANNFGFRHARADHVVFMNSDIHWRTFAPLEHGLELLRRDTTLGLVGFELHFEDGAIQHAGMEFQIAPDLGDMVLCTHPGKGLPGRERGAEIAVRQVEAVTGALMMVRRSDFDDMVFDEGYTGGDFEDGDLCLNVRASGKKIVLVECDGLFHLERQSIHSGNTMSVFATLNGMRFTDRWRWFVFESR